jgi:putative Mg2+ transporter-C (MgtC) family protein
MDELTILTTQGPALVVEVLTAALAGSIMGFEREVRGSPVGMKTGALVCIGSTLYMQVGRALLAAGSSGDPSRMASQIVTGIGFLGAGAILRGQGGITGLTSAATVWFIGAIGVVIGSGYPLSGLLLTLLVLAIVLVLRQVEGRIFFSGPKPQDPGH